jgi:uncharacterized membrane protein
MSRRLAHLKPGARAIAAAFVISGTIHLARPQVFDPLMPPALPAPQAWIAGTGVAELVSAGGLLAGTRWGPGAATLTLLAVWPGNWWYAMRLQGTDAQPALRAAAWLRVPLQIPMLAAVHDPYRTAAA